MSKKILKIPTEKSSLRQKRKFWQAHVEAWKDSQLSQAEYCRDHGLKSTGFNYWVSKKTDKLDHPLALVEIPIQKIPICSDAALKLNINNCYQIEIADHFSSETLAQVLQTLRRIG